MLILATLRSDFLGTLQLHPSRLESQAGDPILLGPLDVDGFRQVIEGPARRVGLRLETGLSDRLVRDTPSGDALPLLAFTLRELWDGRADGAGITLKQYDDFGGLAGAVQRKANEVLSTSGATEEEIEALERAFIDHLVRLTSDGQAAKQPARLEALPAPSRRLVGLFVEARLLVSGKGSDGAAVEIVHEALLRTWPTLMTWIERGREALLQRLRVRRLGEDLSANAPERQRRQALEELAALAASAGADAQAVEQEGAQPLAVLLAAAEAPEADRQDAALVLALIGVEQPLRDCLGDTAAPVALRRRAAESLGLLAKRSGNQKQRDRIAKELEGALRSDALKMLVADEEGWAEHRTDSLSACFRNRDGSYAGDYTSRYRELCAHLGVIATRNNRGVAHENGAIEGPHRHWKRRLEQQLIQRGSRDFATEAEYRQLVAQVTADLNNRASVQQKLAIERLHLRPLPVERFADYEPVVATVRSTSTIELRSVTYSVPSRLIGQQLTVHLRHDRLDLFLRSQFVETLPRLHQRPGDKGRLRRIDFRHVIESLRRKPRALLRAQLQDDILPGESWRQLWRALLAALPPDEAAKVMVDALHVAARTDDLAAVERYLRRQLRRGELTLSSLRDHYGLRPPRGLTAMPQLDIPEHTLRSYDELLGGTPQPASAGNSPAIPAQATETGAVPQPVAGGRTAGHSRRLDPGQLPLCPGRAGTPAAPPGKAAAAVA